MQMRMHSIRYYRIMHDGKKAFGIEGKQKEEEAHYSLLPAAATIEYGARKCRNFPFWLQQRWQQRAAPLAGSSEELS